MRERHQAVTTRSQEYTQRTNPAVLAVERERKARDRALAHVNRVGRKEERDARFLGIVVGHSRADLTADQSNLASILLRSIHERHAFDRHAVLRRYTGETAADAVNAGRIADEVFARVRDGDIEVDVAVQHVNAENSGLTMDCEPMLRNIVLASVPFIYDRDLERCVRLEANLTHCNPISVDASVAAARVARGLVDAVVTAIVGWRTPPIDRTAYAPAVLHAALHFTGTCQSMDEVFERSVSFGGGNNFVSVLACALAGARWGYLLSG